jgi:hypothetical protein
VSEHANGAKSCIAKSLDGGDEPGDFWYEAASEVLDADGFVVTEKSEIASLKRLLDDLTDSDIGEVQASNQELWESNQALHAEVRRLGGGML